MNSSGVQTKPQMRARRSGQNGNSLIELAIIIPALVLLCLGTADFARVFYAAVEVNAAARAGAQYGSQSVLTAADSAGMRAAALLDCPNLTNVSATASQCTCSTGSTVAACAANYCTNNPNATFVTVNTQVPFSSIARYPGLPSSLSLSGKAVMEVGQ